MQLVLIRLITRDVFVVSVGIIRYINMQKLSIICKQIGKTIVFTIKHKISRLDMLSYHLEDSSAEKQFVILWSSKEFLYPYSCTLSYVFLPFTEFQAVTEFDDCIVEKGLVNQHSTDYSSIQIMCFPKLLYISLS